MPKRVWRKQNFPKTWKRDYGTVRAWKKGTNYIHINKVKATGINRSIYKEGYRYAIASNKFGTSHHKTLSKATSYSQTLRRR